MGATLAAARAARSGARLTRAGVAVAVALTLLLGYYAWTATSSGNPFNKVTPFFFKYGDSDYYNLQADAFLHGRLSLDVPVDPALANAEDPYVLDVPAQVPGLVDAAYYHGRYYLAWGPAPALTTFVPARLLGTRIQENLAVTLYAFLGVLCGGWALTLLVRRLLPDTPRALLWAGNATLALGTAIPWILRRPTVYEVAIAAAFCFMMAGLLVLVREVLRAEPRGSRLAAAGALFGLAVLSRPNMGFVVVGVAGLACVLRGRVDRRLLVPVLGLPVVAGGLFMIYNMARFSGPLDFGNQWQLAGRDVRDLPLNDLANLPPSLYGYLLAPFRLALTFPYVQLPPPPDVPFGVPNGFHGEPTAGVLWAVPFVLLALGLARADTLARRVIAVLVGCAALALVPGIYALPGYTERYELDFLPYLVMAATLGWATLVARAATPRRAAWWRRGGLALAAWSVLVGVAIGFTGYYDSFRVLDADRYRTLEKTFSPLPTLATALAGRPMISWIAVAEGITGQKASYTTLDVDDATFALAAGAGGGAQLTIVSPGERDAVLRFAPRLSTPGAYEVAAGAGADASSTAVVDGAAAALPLHLHRGLNHLDLTTTAPRVELRSVRLR